MHKKIRDRHFQPFASTTTDYSIPRTLLISKFLNVCRFVICIDILLFCYHILLHWYYDVNNVCSFWKVLCWSVTYINCVIIGVRIANSWNLNSYVLCSSYRALFAIIILKATVENKHFYKLERLSTMLKMLWTVHVHSKVTVKRKWKGNKVISVTVPVSDWSKINKEIKKIMDGKLNFTLTNIAISYKKINNYLDNFRK